MKIKSSDIGKLKKYLIYAAGEIVLVVIGILIALQLNSWHSYNQDRAIEKEYLSRIAADLKVDTASIVQMILIAKEKQKSLEFILPYLKNEFQDIKDTILFINTVVKSTMLGWAQYEITTGTLDELRNTGNLNLIQNVRLRSEISKYYNNGESEKQRIEKRRGNYPQEIYRLIPRSSDENSWEFAYRNDFYSNTEIIDSIRHSNLTASIIGELNLANFISIRLKSILEDSKSLLKEIENEIENKI
ncbi:MAG: hypothetical protein KDC57_12215 [Saprospiraceae bacterium]|nr:hypothetical protein [Saprospiraceae bacterium]